MADLEKMEANLKRLEENVNLLDLMLKKGSREQSV